MVVFNDPKVRFSDAVYAIGTTPKSLRKWLQNERFHLPSGRPSGGWLNFSAGDIIALAIVRKLVDFCVGVEEANVTAMRVIHRCFHMLVHSKNMQFEAAIAAFQYYVLIATKENEEWNFSLISLLENKESLSDKPAFIVIYLQELVEQTLSRLTEVTEGNSSQEE